MCFWYLNFPQAEQKNASWTHEAFFRISRTLLAKDTNSNFCGMNRFIILVRGSFMGWSMSSSKCSGKHSRTWRRILSASPPQFSRSVASTVFSHWSNYRLTAVRWCLRFTRQNQTGWVWATSTFWVLSSAKVRKSHRFWQCCRTNTHVQNWLW